MVKNERRMVWTTKNVQQAIDKMDDGYILTYHESPFFDKKIGHRKEKITFKISKDEYTEYAKCKADVKYFANNYIFAKTEDGSFKNIELRDYQEDIIDLIDNNKYSIICASRQIGKTVTTAIYILHYMLFNNTKNVLIAANKLDTAQEILDKIKNLYTYLPFFLQQGIETWNQSVIKFENGCRAKAFAMTKTSSIGNTGDFVYLDEFAHIPENLAQAFYKSIMPTLSSIENGKMVISSTPNGLNLFHKLLMDAEREEGDPEKNTFGSMWVYWYQVPGRNVTYMKLNPGKMKLNHLSIEMIYKQCQDIYNPDGLKELPNKKPPIEIKTDPNSGAIDIHIQNTKKVKYEDICKLEFLNKKGETVNINEVANISTWKLDAIKDIGGEESFNQEYDLRFINSSKSILSETTMEKLTESKEKFQYKKYDEFKRLKWNYENLIWKKTFNDLTRKKIFGCITVDVSEGLGQDYSVINIFQLKYKDENTLNENMDNISSDKDIFQFEQIGMFRSNVVSVHQLAEILYLISFEFFNPDFFKIIIEYNNDGKTLISNLKYVFDQKNNYAPYILMKFKHRHDAKDFSYGLRVSTNKRHFVKDYQEKIEDDSIIVTESTCIKEIGTFIKHVTAYGNVTYKADGTSNDDTTMTLVFLSQSFNNHSFTYLTDDFMKNYIVPLYIKNILNSIKYMNKEITQGTDYGIFFDAKQATTVSSTNRKIIL